MKKRAIIGSFTIAWVLGVTTYAVYHYSATMLSASVSQHDGRERATLNQQVLSSSPSPPQPTNDAPFVAPRPEPPRALTGMTGGRLNEIEQYLPEGARIATYPIDDEHLRAAVTKADLNGDGSEEMLAVYATHRSAVEAPTSALMLSVLAQEGAALKLRASTRLAGGMLFNLEHNAAPLIVKDVTGDGRPEIIVASGTGWSLGGQLQIFAFDSSSLQRLGSIGGHFFRIERAGAGKPDAIKAQWKDEKGKRIYRWTGREFEQVGTR